ncbi:MAG: Phenylacetate--CoA ligase [Firmicutes bacterium]|nr:Phenylacetate--CoA ligase [Bacillota bacterium]
MIKVEGKPDIYLVQNALLVAYPELSINTKNSNLDLVIETTIDLSSQIKDVKIIDLR